MSSTWIWFFAGIAGIVLAIVAATYAGDFGDRGKNTPRVLSIIACVLLVVLTVTSFGLCIYNRNNHRRDALELELQKKGFEEVNITGITMSSTATVGITGYPSGCRLSIYKQGNWLLDVAQVTRSVTTPKDMATWPSVKFACNKNAK